MHYVGRWITPLCLFLVLGALPTYAQPPVTAEITDTVVTPPTADELIAKIAAMRSGESLEIVFPKGITNIDKPIDLPNSKKISIRGEFGAKVVLTSTVVGDCIFRLKNDRDSWVGSLRVQDLELQARAAAKQSCFGTDQSDKVNHNMIRLENLQMSSTGYNIYFNNQEYTISPTFRNLRGNHGLYWGGATHSASDLTIEGCRFHNGTRGPQIYVSGARKWTIRNNITEGSVRWDTDVDPDAVDVLKTRGVLLNNPGPNSGNLHAHWCEYWIDLPDYFNITIRYAFNNGGANRPSDYWLTQTSLHKFQAINTSTTDAFSIYANCSTWSMPIFTDPQQFKTSGKVHVYVNGGEVHRRYKFDNPNVTITSGTIITPNFGTDHYKDNVSTLYVYRGGTGVYTPSATKGNWSSCRPYVQHHPKYGHSLVFKSSVKLEGHAFVANMPRSLSNGQPSQEVWVCCPHFAGATITGNGTGIGVVGSIGNRFYYEAGNTPKRYVGSCTDTPTVQFFRINSIDNTSGKWAQIFTSAVWRGGFGDSPEIAENYECYEWPNEPGPPLGTSVVGDKCRPLVLTSPINYWVCTEAGTSRPIATTANAVKNVASLTAVGDITELLIGDFVDVAGASGVYRVMDIADGVVTLDRKLVSPADLVGAAVTNHGPVWTEK
jgi:hypothetical protein